MAKSVKEIFLPIEQKIECFEKVYSEQHKYAYGETSQLLNIKLNKQKIDSKICELPKKELHLHLFDLIKRIQAILNDHHKVYLIANNLTFLYGIDTSKVIFVLEFYLTCLNGYLEEATPTQGASHNSNTLNPDFFQSFIVYEYKGIELFDLENLGVDEKKLINELKLFFASPSHKLTFPINLYTKFDYYGYYIITKIADYSNIDLTKIENLNINNSPYKSKNRTEAISKNFPILKKDGISKNALDFKTNFDEFLKSHIWQG